MKLSVLYFLVILPAILLLSIIGIVYYWKKDDIHVEEASENITLFTMAILFVIINWIAYIVFHLN